MSNSHASGSRVPSTSTGHWIKALGDVFIGFDRNALIQQVLGVLDIAPSVRVSELQGLTWNQFVEAYADPDARAGLQWGWQAIVEGYVAQRHWPAMLPFTPNAVVRLQPVSDDPVISVALHVQTGRTHQVDTMLETMTHDVLNRTARLSQQLLAGTAGPLTDMQVAHIRAVTQNINDIQQFLEELRAEICSLAKTAPQPQSLSDLFAFTGEDFAERRVHTHRLSIESELSAETVYCQPGSHAVIQRLLHTLLLRIIEETAIHLSDEISVDGYSCVVRIQYHSRDPQIHVTTPLSPLTLTDGYQANKSRAIDRQIKSLDSWLRPLQGTVWAEPADRDGAVTNIFLKLPRWHPNRSDTL